jgi:group I intron endonuclease
MEKIIGIYKITSPTNKIYIGQSKDVKSRWNAYKYFERDYACYEKNNKNSLILKSFKKHGYDKHKFEILEKCKIEELDKKEIFYISQYKSNILRFPTLNGLNLHAGGNKPPVKTKITEAEKLKISIKNKENHKLGKYKKVSKIVIKIDKTGNIIKKFKSLTELFKQENFGYNFFVKNFTEINKLYKDGFIYSFEDPSLFKYKLKTFKIRKTPEIKPKPEKKKMSKEEFRLFISKLNKGRKHLNVNRNTKTEKCIKHYKKLHEINKVKVNQYSMNNEYIKTFNSIKEAAEQTNSRYQSISRVCRGGRKSAYGYKWKYFNDLNPL